MKTPAFVFGIFFASLFSAFAAEGPHFGLAFPLGGRTPSGKEYPALSAVYPKAMVNEGDLSRLDAVFTKAAAGKRVVIAVIGGSITEGAKATKPEYRWGEQMAGWWRRTFPKAEIAFVNAGIGATGSHIAVYRADRDLLSRKPDFVGIEFAVNDGGEPQTSETIEGLIRQILFSPSHPAALMVYMMARNGGNVQKLHLPVAKHYGLPALSYRDALWPLIEAKKLDWTDISPDNVHPNDIGHTYVAAFVCQFLQNAYEHWLGIGRPASASGSQPAPLFTAAYDYGRMLDLGTVKMKDNIGFKPLKTHRWGAGWYGEKPGDKLAFSVPGPNIDLLFYKIHGPYGKARLSVDGKSVAVMDGWFDQTWGGYTPFQSVIRNSPGEHLVEIEILPEKSPASEGHRFEIQAVMTTGK